MMKQIFYKIQADCRHFSGFFEMMTEYMVGLF